MNKWVYAALCAVALIGIIGHLFFSLKILGAIGFLALIAVAVTSIVEGMKKR